MTTLSTEPREWHQYAANLSLLCGYMAEQCDSAAEASRVVQEIINKPWKWRAEFEEAKRAREVDERATEIARDNYRDEVDAGDVRSAMEEMGVEVRNG